MRMDAGWSWVAVRRLEIVGLRSAVQQGLRNLAQVAGSTLPRVEQQRVYRDWSDVDVVACGVDWRRAQA